MRAMIVGLAVAAAGCPRPAAGPATPSAAPLGEEIARLAIPPTPASTEATARLRARGEAGDTAAAWARVHYLIDLFDDARFRRDDDSLRALAAALGQAPARGAEATDAMLDALLVELDAVLARERLHPEAAAARTLLAFDREPPRARAAVMQRMAELDRIAEAGGPLAANARLRLFGFCRQAFADAAQAPRPTRRQVLAFCLYPLYDADPAPYFADDPDARPPPPRWQDLSDAMMTLAGDIAGSSSRLSLTGRTLAENWPRFISERAARLPTRHTPAALGVPTVARADAYADEPLLAIGDRTGIASRDALTALLRQAVRSDPRGAVAVSLHGRASADTLYAIAGPAREAGADVLHLAVGVEQTLVAPPGDYWHGRTGDDGAVTRLGVIPVSLAELVPGGSEGLEPREPRALGWDARRAGLGLHLVVASEHWRLVAPGGAVADLPAGDTRALRAQLVQVRAAFADDDGLRVAIDAGASYAAAVSALVAARHAADGAPLFPRLALVSRAPAPRSSLGERIARRAAARVDIEPAALADRAPSARRCYQELLDTRPQLTGAIRLELAKDAVTAKGPPPLRGCAEAALTTEMRKRGTASATVTFSLAR